MYVCIAAEQSIQLGPGGSTEDAQLVSLAKVPNHVSDSFFSSLFLFEPVLPLPQG